MQRLQQEHDFCVCKTRGVWVAGLEGGGKGGGGEFGEGDRGRWKRPRRQGLWVLFHTWWELRSSTV